MFGQHILSLTINLLKLKTMVKIKKLTLLKGAQLPFKSLDAIKGGYPQGGQGTYNSPWLIEDIDDIDKQGYYLIIGTTEKFLAGPNTEGEPLNRSASSSSSQDSTSTGSNPIPATTRP